MQSVPHRHARACRGHPRLATATTLKTWMAGTSPAMTAVSHCRMSLASVRRLPALAQEAEELHALAQAPLHHLRAHDHLAHDRGDLRRAEIEALVEIID